MSKQLHETITEAVRALAEGHGASLHEIALQPDLMSLGCVVAEASDHGRTEPEPDVVAGVVAFFFEEAANALAEDPHAATEPNRAAAARAALALEPGTQGKPLRGVPKKPGRASAVAMRLGYQQPSLFKLRQDGRNAFDDLVHDMAEHLTRREVSYRVSEQRLAQQARRPPLESAMRVDWLPRFERYYRIWSPIAALTADLKAGLAQLQTGAADDVDYFTRKSLYYYAGFVNEVQRFIRERGGLWVLPDPASEQLVADATWMIRQPTPLNEIDESMLRLAIAEWSETATFIQATHHDAALKRITASWGEWMCSCACEDQGKPMEECQVHQCMHWGSTFTSTLEAQWDALADWYEVGRPKSVVAVTVDAME